ncbi:MAG: hypothetical protein JWN89_585 [Parcubacteria group bacterium]|nr:hypothetical protein [Parcubacteria group bacterium]
MEKGQISNTMSVLLIGLALFFDGVQVLMTFLFLGWLVGLVAFMTFWLLFKLLGISFATPKRAGIMGGGFIIEMIPFISALPAWTLAVTLIILDTKIKKVAGKVAGITDISEKQKPQTSRPEDQQRAA